MIADYVIYLTRPVFISFLIAPITTKAAPTAQRKQRTGLPTRRWTNRGRDHQFSTRRSRINCRAWNDCVIVLRRVSRKNIFYAKHLNKTNKKESLSVFCLLFGRLLLNAERSLSRAVAENARVTLVSWLHVHDHWFTFSCSIFIQA